MSARLQVTSLSTHVCVPCHADLQEDKNDDGSQPQNDDPSTTEYGKQDADTDSEVRGGIDLIPLDK